MKLRILRLYIAYLFDDYIKYWIHPNERMRAVGPIDKSHNPYESIYRSLNLSIGDDTSFDEAEELTRHLGMIHNTLGLAIKDLVEVLKHSFPEKQRKRRRIEIDDSYM